MNNIVKKQRLKYMCIGNPPDYKLVTYKLKVKDFEQWGDEKVIKCKVLTKGWYEEIYLTESDFRLRRVKK